MLQEAVLEGWRVPGKGLWRILIARGVRANTANLNPATVVLKVSPIELLADTPLPTEHILNVYELKTRTELVRYYYATAGFPTQPTWIKATQNGHYQPWPGLTAALAASHFPESDEAWRGHGRKIKSNL